MPEEGAGASSFSRSDGRRGSRAYVVTAALALDGTGNRIERPAVVVRDGRIAEIASGGDVPAGLPVIHFEGATLLPGLIDTHCHLTLPFDQPLAGLFKPAIDLNAFVAIGRASARRALEGGVTTVRDVGSPFGAIFEVKREIEGGIIPGPRLVASGVPLTVAGGSCDDFGGVVTGIEDAFRLIDRQIEAGAAFIKIMATGGFATGKVAPSAEQFEAEDLRRMVAYAHRRGVPVASHCHGVGGIRASLDAGVDTIEHCTFLTPEGFFVDANLLHRIARSDTVVVQTLQGVTRHPERAGPDRVRQRLRVAEDLTAAGVVQVIGTDAGAPGVPHDSAALEVIAVARTGLSSREAIVSATARAAAAIGLGSETGRLVRGFAADLIAVPGDPEADLSVLTRPVAVYLNGAAA